jgi:LemA protein
MDPFGMVLAVNDMVLIGVVIGIVVIGGLWFIGIYNGLVRARNETRNAWSQIDVELKRRHDLIPNLIETAKGYMRHEAETLERVVMARNAAAAAQGPAASGQAEGALNAALGRFFAVAEQYPDLKANQNFLALQEELTGTESKIAYARQFYNDQVMRLNTLIQSFPSNLIASTFHFTPREFFDIEDPVRGPVQVDLS